MLSKIKNDISTLTLEFGLDALKEQVAERFVYMDDIVETIYVALVTNNNAILFGPGGFGKSELLKYICEILGINVYTKVCYEGMTPDELLGIPNMKKFLEESTHEIAFENTVFCQGPGILLLEEFMDVDPSTSACLKDIITEGGWRHGNDKVESKISSIFITGNVDPDEKALDETTKALYEERFPLRERVIWSSFQRGDYFELLRKVYPDNDTEIAVVSELCTYTTQNETVISPRVALYAAKVAINVGLQFLYKINKLDCTMLQEYIETSQQAISIEQQRIKLDSAKERAVAVHNDSDTLEKLIIAQFTIKELLKQKIEYHDALVEEIRDFHSFLKVRLSMIESSIEELVKADDHREVINI